jgi:hypothetical protein
MFRILLCTAFLSVVSVSIAGEPPSEKSAALDKKADELVWAKDVASDFVSSVLGQNLTSAEMLMTDDFKKTQKDPTQWIQSPLHVLFAIATMGAAEWTIERETIAPDQDEAVFRGPLKHAGGESVLTVRVIKDGPKAKWRVNFYNVAAAKANDAPKK